MKAFQLIRNTVLTGFCAGLLAGCSWLDDWPPGGSDKTAQATPKPPESKIMQTSEGTWLESSREAQAVQPKGLAVDAGSADRIAQLEAAIAGIRNDLDMMMPALTKLAEAQGDLQKVLGSVEPASGGPVSMAAPAPQPVPVAQPAAAQPVGWYEQQEKQNRANPQPTAAARPPAQQTWQQQPDYAPAYQQAAAPQQPAYAPVQPQPSYQPPAQPVAVSPQAYQQPAAQPASLGGAMAATGAYVSNVRFGEHADKTRLVIDTSDKVAFSYDVDNNERILMIELPGSGWQGAQEMQISNSPLISSYNVVSDNQGGHQLIMQLKQPVQVLWAQALAPGGPQGHRVVFDLAPI